MGRIPSMTALLALLAVAGYKKIGIRSPKCWVGRGAMEPTIKAAWVPFWVSWNSAARAPVGSSAEGSVNSWSASSKADEAKRLSLGSAPGPTNLALRPSSSGRSGLRSSMAQQLKRVYREKK